MIGCRLGSTVTRPGFDSIMLMVNGVETEVCCVNWIRWERVRHFEIIVNTSRELTKVGCFESNFFVFSLKCPSFTSTQSVQFILRNFYQALSLCVPILWSQCVPILWSPCVPILWSPCVPILWSLCARNVCSIKKYDIVGGKVCDPYSTDSMNNSIDLKMLKSCLDHHRRRRLEAKFLRNHPQLHSGGRLDQPEPTGRPADRPTGWRGLNEFNTLSSWRIKLWIFPKSWQNSWTRNESLKQFFVLSHSREIFDQMRAYAKL